MNQKPISILVFIYNSYKDPLFQNLLFNYIKTLSANGTFRFDLITFEQAQYGMSPSEMKNEKVHLAEMNIHWHPKPFHTGRFLLLKKLIDVISTLITVIRIKIRYRSTYVFAFANVAAAFSILFSQWLGLKLVIYSYEPHSEFMADLGLWSRKDLKYKILNFLERRAGKKADHVLTGTKHGLQLLKDIGSSADTHRAPTAVDPNDFYFRPNGRAKIRKQLNLVDQHLYLYIGKFGGLYYTQEFVQVCKKIYDLDTQAFFVVVTSYDHREVHDWFSSEKIPQQAYTVVGWISNEEIKEYLSAADIGISAVPPSPAQRYRSPTKVAEYLLCGLPYITCTGVSEDDEYAQDYNVGVVLKDFSAQSVEQNYEALEKLLDEDRTELRSRCRTVGLEYRSKEKIDLLLKNIFI